MAPVTNLFRNRHKSTPAAAVSQPETRSRSGSQRAPGIRTRVLLLTSLVVIITATTASSLYIIRSRLRQQVRANFDADLRHSVETFQDLEAGRLAALERENALMAALPSLKALMTTNDRRTIADDAVEFFKTSGNDLFALADADGRLQAAEAVDNATPEARAALDRSLQIALADTGRHYLLSNGRLFEYSVHPLYFGSQANGTLLGYVIGGYAIDRQFLREVGHGAGADAAFVASNPVVVTALPAFAASNPVVVTALPAEKLPDLYANASALQQDGVPVIRTIGRERYLAVSKDLSPAAGSPLRLVVMKSFDQADRAERAINRLVLLVGLLAMAAGSVLMLLLARMVTGPLERLATGVRAFGSGDLTHSLPEDGTQEVRYLSEVFARMRDEIQKTNHALLESERLATIGRMASSVSHDLRHYLAAVYANAEFLASPTLPAGERAELFEEIRLAVNGTTDMLDSLLTFSRTGSALQRVPTTLAALVERAVALVRTHPDAENVVLRLQPHPADSTAALDTKQIERAVYNLLLNACQSARIAPGIREVSIALDVEPDSVSVTICDSGAGVAPAIRDSLFDPFVSEGKQRGTGLGLTLAWSVAREHDGDVKLLRSQPGETVFRLTVARHLELISPQADPPHPPSSPNPPTLPNQVLAS